jgi:hypothetical protein
MLQKLNCIFLLLVATSSVGLAQSRTLNIGDVALRLGMPRDTAMKILTTKYKVSAMGPGSFSVSEYDQAKKQYNILGSIGFDNNQLTYINREIDTSGWPNDEGFAVAKAIYDVIHDSIPITDRDGAKRANVNIVVSSHEASRPLGTLRNIYIDQRQISITTFDGPDGKSVSASLTIRTKPW